MKKEKKKEGTSMNEIKTNNKNDRATNELLLRRKERRKQCNHSRIEEKKRERKCLAGILLRNYKYR